MSPRIWLYTCLGLAAVYGCLEFADQQFRIDNISFGAQKEAQGPNEEQLALLKNLFSQPFKYLDRGRQSFVFESEDGKYALKFFDARRLKGTKSFFLTPRDPERLARKKKHLLEGYKVAFLYDQKYSGLLYVHLGPSHSLNLKATVYDRFGIKHTIDLDHVPFVIQKKATTTRDVLTQLLEKGDLDEAKHKLRQIIDMYVDEYRLGIHDLDHNFMYNTGFVDGSPIRVDVGRLRKDETMKYPSVFSYDLEKIAIHRVGDWTQRHFPQYREELLQDMRAKLNEVSTAR